MNSAKLTYVYRPLSSRSGSISKKAKNGVNDLSRVIRVQERLDSGNELIV